MVTAPRNRTGRRIGTTAVAWVLVALVLRVAVVAPERCPPVGEGELDAAAVEAIGWFDRNQRDDGRWLYRYDVDRDADLGDYNVVRHAGVTMSLYQSHAAGYDQALDPADRGTAYALENLVRHGDWAAFEPDDGTVSAGATGLLVAGLVHRREATGDDRHDEVLADMGRFLVELVEPNGAVAAEWDPATGAPVPDAYSPFFTGEVYWALSLLHLEFPDAGWDDAAGRIGQYLAVDRDDTEGWFPDISDHWAAYGLSVQVGWPGADEPLSAEQVAYAERQAGMAGIQVRWESQRTDAWPNWWLRGRKTLGAGLGTLGEQLTGLWGVARDDDRLASLHAPLGDRARCVAGILVDRQVSPEEAADAIDPDRARGAWFQFGVTQMDDQQHALSAILRSQPIVASLPVQTDRARGDGAAVLLVLAAVVLAVGPFRAAASLRGAAFSGAVVRRERGPSTLAVTVAGGVATTAALGLLAWSSGPLLDALDSSVPTARIGAGLVLLVASVVDLVRRIPVAEPVSRGWAAALVPVAVPLLLRPTAAVLALSGGADRGVALVLVAGIVATALAAGGVAAGNPAARWLARFAAAAGVLVGVALAVDGIYHV
jgi:hypothetical protein